MEHGSYGRAEAEPGTVEVTDVAVNDAAVIDVAASEVEPGRRPVGVRRRGASPAQRGMVSAEWAVGIIAAIAIAGVLLSVVTSGAVKALMLKVILTVIGTFAKFTG